MKRVLLFGFFSCLGFIALVAQPVQGRVSFNDNWTFKLNEEQDASAAKFDDKGWRKLSLPHDWSVELPFDKESPTGTGGGALRGGLGWYRKSFATPTSSVGKKVFIEFDGVYMNSEVFINGKSLGARPNGYISFRYDLTAFLNKPGMINVIAVKVDNSKQPNSRWYSGSGIFRNVWLTVSDNVHVAHWGTYVTTPSVNAKQALLQVQTTVQNESPEQVKAVVENALIDAAGKTAAVKRDTVTVGAMVSYALMQVVQVNAPKLWSVSKPNMYRLRTRVLVGGQVKDVYETPVGFRWFEFDAQQGFLLNGQHLKIRGVCMHHDLGALGAAINKAALKRQLEILQGMGCNAIRTSHNPPTPELLSLCDEMGFVVMDEAFDMWSKPKSTYDYANVWDKWYATDLRDQMRRDRNHPSVIIWSLGNEIYEQWTNHADTLGRAIMRSLYAIQKEMDPTRPAVTANNETRDINQLLLSGAYDLVGYNYHEDDWTTALQRWNNKPFIVTESTSALQTRGFYEMPSDSVRLWPRKWDEPFTEGNKDTACSAYDNCRTPWGTTHETSLRLLEKYDHISGMFIWTGFDYLGEPTPYPWPARSSYFGIVDLAGFPKDVYYLYQSAWTEKPVLHIFPHWNWKPGQEIDVWAYYSQADEVELYLNGRSLGTRRLGKDQYHIQWRVKYEPGILKAVSRKDGKMVLTRTIQTAGDAAQLQIVAEKNIITTSAQDMAFVQVSVQDKAGNLAPDSDNEVSFIVEGPGTIAGVDNGNPTSMESFKAKSRKAFHGKCMAMIKPTGKPGVIKVTVKAAGLTSAVVSIVVK